MNIKKRIYTALLAATVLIGAFATIAFANNCSDTDWSCQPNCTEPTTPRIKTDATSLYCKVNNGVVGGGTYVNAKPVYYPSGNKTYYQIDGYSSKTFYSSGSSAYIPSLIYERHGQCYAGLRIYHFAQGLGRGADGIWSPDSV